MYLEFQGKMRMDGDWYMSVSKGRNRMEAINMIVPVLVKRDMLKYVYGVKTVRGME